MASSPKRLRAGLVAGVLVAFQLWSLQGVPQTLDLIVSDDCNYLWHGRRLFAGSGEWDYLLSWSGPYQVLYGLFDRLGLGLAAPDAMCALLAVASTLALFWAVAAATSLEAAGAAAIVWAAGSSLAGCLNGVYALGATAAFVAGGWLLRGREKAGAAAGFVAAAARPEILLWVGAAGIVAAVLGRRRTGLVLAVGSAALLALQVSVDEYGRSAMAFRQHYARGAAMRQAAAADDPAALGAADPQRAFEYPDPWVKACFGDARDLSDALAANPREVVRHVRFNLAELGEMAGLFLGRFPASPVGRAIAGWTLALLGLTGLVDLLTELRRRGATVPGVAWNAALALSAPALAVSSLLYGPRELYLVAGFLPLALLSVRGGRRLACLSTVRRALARLGAGAEGLRLRRADVPPLALAALLLAATFATRVGEGLWSGPAKWRSVLAAAQREGGAFAVAGEPYRADVLLPPDGQLVGLGGDVPDRVRRVLLHATDVYAYRNGMLAPWDDEGARRILEDPAWRPIRYVDDVLLLERSGR